MATPDTNPLDAASPLEPSQPLAVAAGSVPWAWTHSTDSEYWNPAGKSRDEAIHAGKRLGYRKFWIAQTRKMTAEEMEEYDGTWIVDPTTQEEISLNNPSHQRAN